MNARAMNARAVSTQSVNAKAVNARTRVRHNLRWYGKKYRKGYKLLRFDPTSESGHLLCSAMLTSWPCVLYDIGRWTVPRVGCGPLGVFTSLNAALVFAAGWYRDRFVVAECYYVQTAKERSFWYVDPATNTRVRGGGWWSGSDFADRLILTRLVPVSELAVSSRIPYNLNALHGATERYYASDCPKDWSDPRTLEKSPEKSSEKGSQT